MKNLKHLFIPLFLAFIILSGCKKDSKVDDAIPEVLDCTTISTNMTLVKRGSSPDYIIPCRINVEAVLKIEPGVEIAFGSDGGLEIRSAGTLNAQGTPANPIIMRGESPVAGFWRGIRFSSSNNSNKLHFTTIDGGGGLSWDGGNIKANVSISGNSKVEIKNSTISNSASDGVHVARLNANDDCLAGFDGNTFSGNNQYPLRVIAANVKDLGFNTFSTNGINKIEVHEASGSRGIIGNQSWTNPGGIIFINNNLDVGGGGNPGSLTIGEGVIIEMASDRKIQTNSTSYLKINGTASNPVVIRGENSLKDFWKGIYISSNDINNVFTYANISDGGSSPKTGGPHREVVRLGSTIQGPYRLTMNNCIISNSTQCGLRYSSDPNKATFDGSNNTFVDLGEDICDF